MADGVCKGCSYALQKNDNFCTSCGLKVPNFCSQCGNLSLSCDCKEEDKKEVKTLKDFLSEKGKERVTFRPKKNLGTTSTTTTKKQNKTSTNVNINVALMWRDSTEGELKIKRGSRATISVSPSAGRETVKELALQKHSNLDQYFLPHEDYVLLYRDGKLCHLLPGTNQRFTVEKYKQFLQKPYGKVELFLCLEVDFLDIDKDNNNTEEESNENKPPLALASDEFLLNDFPVLFPNNDDVQSCSKVEEVVVEVLQEERKFLCPTCGKSYPQHLIATHADACAEAANNTFMKEIQPKACDIETINSTDEEVIIADQEVLPDPKTMLASVIQNCCVKMDGNAPKIHLEVFRGSCFKDFHSYFNKTWNKTKSACCYDISFAGESGQDEGGLRREFYTGTAKVFFLPCIDNIMSKLSNKYINDPILFLIGRTFVVLPKNPKF